MSSVADTAPEGDQLIAWVDQAVQANAMGKLALAEQLLGQVLDRIGPGTPPDELILAAGRARVTLALTRFETGRREEAFALLDDAVRLANGPTGNSVRVLAAIQRAGLEGRLGNWSAALATMEGLGGSAAEVSPRADAVVAINAGLARQFLGDVTGSAAELERAERLADEHGFDELAAAAVHNQGRLAFVRGDLSQALALMDRARKLVDVRIAQSDLDQARVLLDAGLLDAADELLASCEQDAKDEHLVHDLGEITMEFARLALLLGDYPLARERALRAAAVFAEQGEPAWQAQAELLEIEAGLAAGQPSPELARRAAALADGPAAAGGVGPTATLLAAEAHVQAGELDQARVRLAEASRHRLSLPDRLQRHLVRVTIAATSGDTGGFRRNVRAAVTALGQELGRRSGLDTRTAMALHGRRLRDLDIDLALGSGEPAVIFEACERWRGVSQRLPSVTVAEDPELASRLTVLRQTQLSLREARGDADELRRHAAELEYEIQRRDWGTGGADSPADQWTVAPAVGISTIRDQLAARGRTGLVSLFVHRDRLRSVTVTADGDGLTDLAPVSEVRALAERVSSDLASLSRASDPRISSLIRSALAHSVSALGDTLAPAIPATDRVVVLPSPLLASMPWRMVPQLVGKVVTVSPSATFWAGGRAGGGRTARGTEVPPMTAIAGPGLPGAVAEVAAVTRVWAQMSALSRPDATGADLITALQDTAVVHVAAHGIHHEQSPLFSSILLADGPLFAHELQSAGVAARHVVLSACDVGRALVRPGEEPLGLTAALLACGVESVIAAVAPVRDGAMAEVMAGYHRQVASGVDAALALAAVTTDHPEAELFCAYGRDWAL